MKKILIVLGSLNSSDGVLSSLAVDRLNYCLSVFKPEEHLILCTGGFGAHFNVSDKPHAYYTTEYLVNEGVNRESIMKIALSSNTVDDAVKVKEILGDANYQVEIITSDYHLERVKIIFNAVMPRLEKEYIGVLTSGLTKNELNKLIEHEQKAISGIKKNGLYF